MNGTPAKICEAYLARSTGSHVPDWVVFATLGYMVLPLEGLDRPNPKARFLREEGPDYVELEMPEDGELMLSPSGHLPRSLNTWIRRTQRNAFTDTVSLDIRVVFLVPS